jgi:arylsulfatase
VILVDDMGFSDLGCYGGEIPTPNLDRLAANGVRFTQFYNTARCSPSRSSLMTGLYPHQAGMGHLDDMVLPNSRGYQGRLADESATIAEVLKGADYSTAISGKWHLGQLHGTPPWERGFERSLNSIAGRVYFPDQSGTQGYSLYLNGRAVGLKSPELGDSWYSPDLWTTFGLRFIDEDLPVSGA